MCSKCTEPRPLTSEQKLVFDKLTAGNSTDLVLVSCDMEGHDEPVAVIAMMTEEGATPLAVLVNDKMYEQLTPKA